MKTYNESGGHGNLRPTGVDDDFEGQGMGADFDTLVNEDEKG